MEAEWREVRIGDLVNQGALSISDGYRVRNEELGPEGVPFVRGGDIGDGWINTDTKDHIRPEFVERVRAKLTEPGDAAFITKGTVGRAGRLRPDQPPVVFAPQVAYWRVVDRKVLDPGFIFYLMRSHEFQSALDGVKTHGAMAADYVSISQQHDFRFRFPDVETQRAIAQLLGALDDKIEVNQRTSKTLDSLVQAIFRSWFVDFDPAHAKREGRGQALSNQVAELFPRDFENSESGEIPVGWIFQTVDDEFAVTMGQSPPGETYNETGDGLPFYQGRGDFGFRFPTRRVFCTAPTRHANAGDTLISVRAPVGDINMADEECSIGRGVAAARHRSGSRSYTYYFMRSLKPIFDRFDADGTVFGSISKKDFHSIRRAMPPRTLIDTFESVAAPLDQRILVSEYESRTLAALRDTLLPKLISGTLHIEEAERAIENVA